MEQKFHHKTVLKNETIETILPSERLLNSLEQENKFDLFFLDATLGGGGHALHLVDRFFEIPQLKKFKLNLIAIDRDEEAIQHANQLLSLKQEKHNFQFHILHDNFMNAGSIIPQAFPNQEIHGLYADFGVSSPQLDHAERGFSFLQDGPVDMRMDKSQSFSAKELLMSYSEKELIRIFFDYGEEPKARKLAQSIVKDREKNLVPLENIKELAQYFKQVLSYPPNSKMHPATRTFQALRIEVNDELKSIEEFLDSTPKLIHSFGKASFISFHSLEDRLVKHAMRNWQKGKLEKEKRNKKNDWNIPLHLELHLYDNKKETFGKENPRGGIVPSEDEIKTNSRSRSARLRCFEFVKNSQES
jgi:16S rRNA (cytosine1402-N4)-methyltransferase